MGATGRISLILAIGFWGVFSSAGAQNGTVASVESIRGEVQSGGAPIFEGQRISPGARLTTGSGAQLVLRFDDGMRIALDEQSILMPVEVRSGQATFDLVSGTVRVRTGAAVRSNPAQFALRTSYGRFGVEGPADFTVLLSDAAYLGVNEGSVVASNTAGSGRFGPGTRATVRAGAVPAQTDRPATPAIARLNAVDLERRAEEAAAAAAAAAALERRAGPPPRAQKFWIGASAGITGYDDATTGRLLSQGTQDTQAFGFKVFAGYQFARNFGLEAAYVDLGTVDYSGTFQGMAVTNGELKIAGFDIAVVGSLPVAEKVLLFAKLGMFIWEAQADDVAGGVPFSTTTRGEDPVLGVGFAYALSPSGALRAELDVRRTTHEVAPVLSLGYELRF